MKSTTRNITMPRKTKRRLSLNQSVRDVIPYSRVRVEWTDILSDSGWADEKSFKKKIKKCYEKSVNLSLWLRSVGIQQ